MTWGIVPSLTLAAAVRPAPAFFCPSSALVLFVGYLLQPVDRLAAKLLLDGDVRHRRGWRGAVPVLLTRLEPDHVAGADLLDRAALTLHPAATGAHDQSLAQRMRVPRRARARLERDAGAACARRLVRGEQGVDANGACKPLRRSSGGRLGSDALDVHTALLARR